MKENISMTALKLYDIGAIKFGEFILKSGAVSPVYLDIRIIISYPQMLQLVGDLVWKKISHLKFDVLCGVPYTALPIATYLSIEHGVPMILKRKEAKEYGTKKIIEGIYQPEQRVLVIEDVISTGSSILETVEPLKKEGLVVEDIAIFVDREQGGVQKLQGMGYNIHALFTMKQLLQVLHDEKRIETDLVDKVNEFLENNK